MNCRHSRLFQNIADVVPVQGEGDGFAGVGQGTVGAVGERGYIKGGGRPVGFEDDGFDSLGLQHPEGPDGSTEGGVVQVYRNRQDLAGPLLSGGDGAALFVRHLIQSLLSFRGLLFGLLVRNRAEGPGVLGAAAVVAEGGLRLPGSIRGVLGEAVAELRARIRDRLLLAAPVVTQGRLGAVRQAGGVVVGDEVCKAVVKLASRVCCHVHRVTVIALCALVAVLGAGRVPIGLIVGKAVPQRGRAATGQGPFLSGAEPVGNRPRRGTGRVGGGDVFCGCAYPHKATGLVNQLGGVLLGISGNRDQAVIAQVRRVYVSSFTAPRRCRSTVFCQNIRVVFYSNTFGSANVVSTAADCRGIFAADCLHIAAIYCNLLAVTHYRSADSSTIFPTLGNNISAGDLNVLAGRR